MKPWVLFSGVCLTTLMPAPGLTSSEEPHLADLVYNSGAPGSVNRSLFDILREHVSVRDFGAQGNCTATGESNCSDATPAFAAALAAADGGVVHVPPGTYRIDGTIYLGGELVVDRGATLRRIAGSSNSTDPLVRLGATRGTLRGSGTLMTDNPSPRGVVNIGPQNLSRYANVEFNTVEEVTLQGAGCSWTTSQPWDQVDMAQKGSRGLGMDSSQGWAMTHGGSESTGSCYQNTVRNIQVFDIDVGVYLGPEVNGNQVSGVMMGGIGEAAYFIDGPNSENTISSGFVAGFGGNVTIIKALGSMFNYFMSVAAEPGGGSKYFDFKQSQYGDGTNNMPSIWNTVIGQDNTFDQGETCPIMPASCAQTNPKRPADCDQFCKGPETNDPNFIYMQHGQLHLGNFSASVRPHPFISHSHVYSVRLNCYTCLCNHQVPLGTPSRGEKLSATAQSRLRPAPKLSWEYQLQVEGNGWVRNLTHGLPHTRLGQNDVGVVTVDAEPAVLTSVDSHKLQISNLQHAGGAQHQGGGAYYEIAVAGSGFGRECAGACVYSAKFMVVPVAAAPAAGLNEAFLSVTALGTPSGVTLLHAGEAAGGGDGAAVNVPGSLLQFALRKADQRREVVVDVRRAGRPCTDAIVELV